MDCGLANAAEVAKRLELAGSHVDFQADTRSAPEPASESTFDAIILALKGPVGRWLFRVRQMTGKVPVAVLQDSEFMASDVLKMLASGISVLLRSDSPPALITKACELSQAGYIIIPSPFIERRIKGLLPHRIPLTSREVEVLRLVSQGKSNSEIAKELFIAEVTVRNHLSNIFKKTGFHNRTGAGMAFTLAELVSGEEK